MLIKYVALICIVLLSTSCATQRYGRATPVPDSECRLLDCKDIKLKIIQAKAFIENVRRQQSQPTGAHVLGALGDFGIGNVMEGHAAEESAVERIDQLRSLYTEKDCERHNGSDDDTFA